MHGRKRTEYKAMMRDPQVAHKLASKAEKWHVLMATLQQGREAQMQEEKPPVVSAATSSSSLLALNEKAVVVNADPVWLWNLRRELLLKSSTTAFVTHELSVTQTCLQGNPKAYGAWFHRKWCLLQALKMVETNPSTPEMAEAFSRTTLLSEELQLTERFLQRDERNFHGWNYRRFVVALLLGSRDGSWPREEEVEEDTHRSSSMQAQVGFVKANDEISTTTRDPISPETRQAILQAEWDFTTTKIASNFSNCSALHYRSKLLPMLLLHDGDMSQDRFTQELELVENAVFTEPDDQTAWWYQGFLLSWSFGVTTLDTVVMVKRWEYHAEQLRELAQEAPSKWVALGLVQVLTHLAEHSLANNNDEKTQQQSQECKALWTQLIDMDPDRKVRYQQRLQALSSS